MTFDEFSQAIAPLVASCKDHVPEATYHAYFECLKDLDAARFESAVYRTMLTKTSPWLPQVSELRQRSVECVLGRAADPGEAWALVRGAMSKHGAMEPGQAREYLAHRSPQWQVIWQAVQQAGGWRRLCEASSDYATLSAQFERRYSTLVNRVKEQLSLPAGERSGPRETLQLLEAVESGKHLPHPSKGTPESRKNIPQGNGKNANRREVERLTRGIGRSVE